jgi:hypothetical protein
MDLIYLMQQHEADSVELAMGRAVTQMKSPQHRSSHPVEILVSITAFNR